MTYEGGRRNLQKLEQGIQHLGHFFHAVHLPKYIALTMPGQVRYNDSIGVREFGNQPFPHGGALQEAMQQHNSRSRTVAFIINVGSVILKNHFSIFTGKYPLMSPSKQIVVTAFALFSLFFGAGNLILPPFLGYNAGESWFWVSLGFAVSAVVIPIVAIYGHARLQGTMLDFANKVSPLFALVYSILIYAISISLPSPRTASVAYEMAIKPYFELSSLGWSIIYFALVLVFVLNRSKLLELIGNCLLYTSPSPRDRTRSRMPSSA